MITAAAAVQAGNAVSDDVIVTLLPVPADEPGAGLAAAAAGDMATGTRSSSPQFLQPGQGQIVA